MRLRGIGSSRKFKTLFQIRNSRYRDLVDGVDRSVGTDFTNTNGNDSIQICVIFPSRFRISGAFENNSARDRFRFSTAERGDDIGRAMAQPLKTSCGSAHDRRLERDA